MSPRGMKFHTHNFWELLKQRHVQYTLTPADVICDLIENRIVQSCLEDYGNADT